jgi:hypothetical protein
MLLAVLETLIHRGTRGDVESPLRRTLTSTRPLAEELTERRHRVGVRTVASLLRQAGYSLQADRKTREGSQHPDRNAPFEYLNANASVGRRIEAGLEGRPRSGALASSGVATPIAPDPRRLTVPRRLPRFGASARVRRANGGTIAIRPSD